MNKLNLLLILLLFGSTPIFAQKIITDRPDQTESPVAVSPGILQIESGILYERNEFYFSPSYNVSTTDYAYPTTLFRLGLVKNLELRVVAELVSQRSRSVQSDPVFGLRDRLSTTSGMSDLQLGFKYQITPLESRVVIGLMGHMFVPTGSPGFTTFDYGMMSRINFSYDVDEKRNISMNLIYGNQDLNFKDNYTFNNEYVGYTLAYGHSLSDRVGVYIEGYGNVNTNSLDDEIDLEQNMDAGLTYLLADNIQLDYSFGWGLGYENDMNYHSVGVSFYIPK